MAKGYGYLRKSSVPNLSKDLAPETQEREVRALAERFGDTDIRILSDWDISGAAKYTDKRTGYLALVRAIEDGSCSAVYSYAMARLGRSSQELNRLFDLCKERKVPVRFAVDPHVEWTATGSLVANTLAGIAQFESQVASERQHARNDTKRQRGESLMTRKPYGENCQPGCAKEHAHREGEDATAVLAAFREAGTYSGAARLLNARGVLARSRKPWWSSSVRVVVQRLDPTIVSAGRGARTVAAFALNRLLVCPTCGRFLTGSSLPQRNGSRWTRYACRAYEAMPHPKVAVAESKVLPWVVRRMKGYRLPGQDVDVARERAELEGRAALLYEDRLDRSITKERYTAYMRPLNEQLRDLDAREKAGNPADIDWDAGPGEVNQQLRTFLGSITLDAGFLPVRANFRFGQATRLTDNGDDSIGAEDETARLEELGVPVTRNAPAEPLPDDLRGTVYEEALTRS